MLLFLLLREDFLGAGTQSLRADGDVLAKEGVGLKLHLLSGSERPLPTVW